MIWYNTKDKLPKHNELVVCYYEFQGDKCLQIMRFYKGISKKEREILKQNKNPRADEVCFGDEEDNNHVPWAWDSHYESNSEFGQDIEWWCPLSNFPWPIEKE